MKIIFAGTPEFAIPSLQALIDSPYEVCAVYTQPDRPSGRGRKIIFSPIKQCALDNNIPVYQPRNFKDEEDIKLLDSFDADVMVVVAYGVILPSTVLDTPRLGCVNVHGSLLPRWRGAAPIHRAIQAGDTETGVTIMQLEEGMDTGPMLSHVACPIKQNDTTKIIHDRLSELGAEALLIALDDLDHGRATPQAQNNELATYAKKIEKGEAKIDWQKSAKEIDRHIRAFNPWPVAYTAIDGETIKLWQATQKEDQTHEVPGTIIQATKEGIDVATAEGVISLQQLQLPGGKILSAEDILNSKKEMFAKGKQFQD